MVVSALSGLLVAYLVLRRLIIGPEAEGVFTLFAILFFLVSVVITGIGIMGEYLGRIFQTLSHRPRFVIRQVIEKNG
jgi:undecaprenyl-phosphate 4-deoxy-4-formamido-L-arabinose transferase